MLVGGGKPGPPARVVEIDQPGGSDSTVGPASAYKGLLELSKDASALSND
jgi:hypothetical protein